MQTKHKTKNACKALSRLGTWDDMKHKSSTQLRSPVLTMSYLMLSIVYTAAC